MIQWFVALLALLATAPAPPPCSPAAVRTTGYPGPGGIDGTPWISGSPGSGMIGVLAYWPQRWPRRGEARVYAGGVAPGGMNAKTFWAFLGEPAKKLAGPELVVRARRLDGPGRWHDSFAAIGYAGQNGVPSYASIIALPTPGCWRLTFTTGQLHATVDMRAVKP